MSILKSKKAALIINTHSRRGKRLLIAAKTLLIKEGFELSLHPVDQPNNLRATVKKVIGQGFTFIIIGGGDGTISECVDELVYKDVLLGVLPLGTANSFIRSLSIPVSLAQAVKVISEGKAITIDLGKINEDYFANAVSIGFATHIAEQIPPQLKRYFGIVAYALQSVRSLRNLRSFEVQLEGSGAKDLSNFSTYQLVIANGAYYGPAPLQSKIQLKSGDITIFTMKGMKPLHLLKAWLLAVSGRKFSEQNIDQIRVSDNVILTTKPILKVSIDGEIKAKTPIRISVASKALQIMVPSDYNFS